MKRFKRILIYLGIHQLLAVRKLPEYISDYNTFKKLQKKDGLDKNFNLKISDIYPILLDKTITHGFDRHYIFHTAWAARVVKKINPEFLVDISSSLYFSSIVSAFLPVKFYDYRPADLELEGLTSAHGDLMKLPFESNSLECISCMHVIEHIGLGRYGDPLDPNGDIKAINELTRVVNDDGYIIFVTPVGKPAIKYNAHRIYSFEQIIQRFSNCKLIEFSLIQDDKVGGSIVYNADPNVVQKQEYACGLFVFQKGD